MLSKILHNLLKTVKEEKDSPDYFWIWFLLLLSLFFCEVTKKHVFVFNTTKAALPYFEGAYGSLPVCMSLTKGFRFPSLLC